MEKWEASIQDYQILTREFSGDTEVLKALLNAQSHLRRKQRIDSIHSINPRLINPTNLIIMENGGVRERSR
ncbi:hypothetical protein KSP40_PGU007393 [Platanthera guangdongensis]|uniref:Uncharacterized protein n=1 Tax=Platanthera guangdongensis TaxID=2320717 RepID=A0ABR2LRQ8_9ASPA